LPAVLATVWHGCGGSLPARTSAALNLQVRCERRTGGLAGLQVQDGRTAERTEAQPTLPPGALRLADRGSWNVDALSALDQQGSFWLSRLQTQTTLDDTMGHRRDLLALLTTQRAEALARPILLGETHRLPARRFAVSGPQDVAATRRRKRREAARKTGRQVRARGLAWAAWMVLVMHLPSARLPRREALGLGRVRWQMARLCKLWKSQGQVDESRRTTPWRIRCAVSAKWLAMLLQPWL
jgi:hypothetical protein